ncbi:MAG: single-stranded DNA-binding protein [Clostridia bacterium]|jgi:single-stranded DNA-binding protein
MVEHLMGNNYAFLLGKISTPLEYSHSMYGEGFYVFKLAVPRLSDYIDMLPVTVSERLLDGLDMSVGNEIGVEGQLRSYNKYIDGGNRLILTVFARDIYLKREESHNPNQIILEGYICKKPIYRITPFKREITDMLLAVNRPYNKSDYIPCIAWGRNARFSEGLNVGQQIKVWGRIQSREYQKKMPDGEIITKVAYEVSISKMEIPNPVIKEEAWNSLNQYKTNG